jgi:hypothetical protein
MKIILRKKNHNEREGKGFFLNNLIGLTKMNRIGIGTNEKN